VPPFQRRIRASGGGEFVEHGGDFEGFVADEAVGDGLHSGRRRSVRGAIGR
jgi:hypothetical protein